MKTNELLEKKLKKCSVKQLVEKLEKNKATEEEIPVMVSILKSRGQDVSKWKKEIVNQQIQDSIDIQSWGDDGSDPKEEAKIEEIPIVKEEIVNSRQQMAQEVDEFVDILIASHREGVYTEVMKALGGRWESDLDELLEVATEEQLKEALSFKKIKSGIKEERQIKKDKSTNEDNEEIQEFKNGERVKFLVKGEFNSGIVKKFYYDKTDECFYYVIQKGDLKLTCKRPKNVRKYE